MIGISGHLQYELLNSYKDAHNICNMNFLGLCCSAEEYRLQTLSTETVPWYNSFADEIHKYGATSHLIALSQTGAEATRIAASECLRSLAAHKPVITHLAEQDNLQGIIAALAFAPMEQKVHLMAVLSEVSYHEDGAERLLGIGALAPIACIVKAAGSEIAAKGG